ncbi:hypothetical protein AKJ16_DCAP23577 [Drosera capensis]
MSVKSTAGRKILYVNRPLDIRKGEGGCFSLGHVMKSLLPEYFGKAPEDGIEEIKQVEEDTHHPEDTSSMNNENEVGTTACDPLEPLGVIAGHGTQFFIGERDFLNSWVVLVCSSMEHSPDLQKLLLLEAWQELMESSSM